jgi:hypothetical protein
MKANNNNEIKETKKTKKNKWMKKNNSFII